MKANLKSTKISLWARVIRNFKIMILEFLILFAIIAAFSFYNKYFYTVGHGQTSGILLKFSHKGKLIKTYEGELITRANGLQNVSMSPEIFRFSVSAGGLVNQLDTIQGKMILVHYQQKSIRLFWNGKSEYLVDSVKQIP
jgi:hypothetical protein